MCRYVFLILLFALMLITTAATPAADKSNVGEILQYFNPSHPKGYLNESQDRSIKKKSFKLDDAADVEPVWNRINGIFVEIPADDLQKAEQIGSIAGVASIDGMSAVLTWRQLEPHEGQYNWKDIDDLAEIANRHKKTLILRVSTDTPDWVFEDGAKSIQYKGADGKQKIMPVFWDTTYLANWANFVKELGKHCDGNPVFHSIGITGGGFGSGTSVLPGIDDVAEGKTGVEELEQKLITKYGMDQKQIVDHWKYVADLFPVAFSKTRMNFDIDAPTPSRAGQNALDEISDYLIYRYGQRVILTRKNVDDGKHGFDQYRVIIKFKPDTITGYELTNKMSADDLEKISHTALDDGVSFIEVPEGLAMSTDETVKHALSHLRAHLGYQLLLTAATIPTEIKAGSSVNASFGFINLGDSAPKCPERTLDKDIAASYKIALEFRNASNKIVALVVHTPATSTTQWASGKLMQWEESLKMPILPAGKYLVCLAIVNSNARVHINFLNGLAAAGTGTGTDGKVVVTTCAPLGTVEFK
jgi:hypothetical protein